MCINSTHCRKCKDRSGFVPGKHVFEVMGTKSAEFDIVSAQIDLAETCGRMTRMELMHFLGMLDYAWDAIEDKGSIECWTMLQAIRATVLQEVLGRETVRSLRVA